MDYKSWTRLKANSLSFFLYEVVEIVVDITETESRMVVKRDSGKEDLFFVEAESFSTWDDENVLEVDSGNSCT